MRCMWHRKQRCDLKPQIPYLVQRKIKSIPTDTSARTITTRSKPSAFPSVLRSKRSAVQTLTEEDVQKDAVIQQTCSECGSKEMRYYTQQLRSADEGTTVFYSCVVCGHRYAHLLLSLLIDSY